MIKGKKDKRVGDAKWWSKDKKDKRVKAFAASELLVVQNGC